LFCACAIIEQDDMSSYFTPNNYRRATGGYANQNTRRYKNAR